MLPIPRRTLTARAGECFRATRRPWPPRPSAGNTHRPRGHAALQWRCRAVVVVVATVTEPRLAANVGTILYNDWRRHLAWKERELFRVSGIHVGFSAGEGGWGEWPS